MAATEEAITEEAIVDVAKMIMAKIATEIIIAMPSRYRTQMVKKIEINYNPTNRESMYPHKPISRATCNIKAITVEAASMGTVLVVVGGRKCHFI